MIQKLIGFVIAAISTVILTVPITSISNYIWLAGQKMPIGLSDLFGMIVHDISSMAVIYVPFTSIMLLIALVVAHLLCRFIPKLDSSFLFIFAGFAGMLALMLILKLTFDIGVIAGSRSLLGLLFHGLLTSVGSYLYWLIGVKKAFSSQMSSE